MTYLTKTFIKNFNFPNPDWDRLPANFPNLPKDGLTREEGHLLDAIKLAYSVSDQGKTQLVKKTVRTSVFVFAFSLITLITLTSSPRWMRQLSNWGTKPVNAATISANLKRNVEEMVESTRSAIRIAD